MATFQYKAGFNLTTLKQGDVLDLGAGGQFSKTAQGGFSPVPSPSAAPIANGSQPTNPAASPFVTPPNPQSILPSSSSSGVVTSQGATQTPPQSSSQPASPSQAPSMPAGPNVGLLAGFLSSTIPPTPPSLSQILATSNIPQMQGNLASIQQTKSQLQDAYTKYVLQINGEGTSQGIVDVMTNEKAKGMQIQMDSLNTAEQLASTNLSNAMTWVNTMISTQQTDYGNAVQSYNDSFNRAYQFQSLYNSAASTQQQNANAYLSSVATMVSSGGTNWAALDPAMKATIQQMEAQAGWPAGTLETFAKVKPGSNILGSVNGVTPDGNAAITFVYSNPSGGIGTIQTINTGTKPVSLFSPYTTTPTSSSSTTGNGYTGSILKGTTLDPQATVKDILANPQHMTALFGAMAQAEGGMNAAGASANNPLDLKFNADMAKLGATDSGIQAKDGGTFSAFPDVATANKAYASVFSTPTYNNLTLDQAIQKWSGYTAPASGSQNSNVQSWVTAIQNGNATMAQVPNTGPDRGLKDAVSQALASTDQTSYSPLASSRFTTAANRIVNNFIQLPQYQLTANGLPYLQRIDAAMKNPGSISDQDLLDSLTKLNTAGNAISDAQVKLITDGQSFADMAGAFGNKFKNGGVLSNSQRQQIQSIAKAIYANYQKGYQPVYDQATKQLQAAGIPEAFWTIPDLNNLSGQAGGSASTGAGNSSSGANTGTTTSGVSWSIVQ